MTATKTTIRASKRRAAPTLPPTLGRQLCRWMESKLVHAEGDYYGKPFRLRPYEKRVIYEAYELNPDGSRHYDRVLWGLPKGNGKTEVVAAVGCAEFAGPVCFGGWREDGTPIGVLRTSPDIPIAAASFDQADLVFGAARTMVREGALNDLCEVFDTEILLKGRPGTLYRVAAVAGANDGKRPTCFLSDELHEWVGTKERVHLVLSNGRAKRRDAWELAITTAGWDQSTLLGKMYLHGKRVQAGTERDDKFLFIWNEADEKWDLNDPVQLEAAIRQANPAVGDFLSLEGIVARYQQIPEHEFRRYHLNQWSAAPTQWIPTEMWAAAARPDTVIPDGTPLVLGFDGSYNRDSTALVGCTLGEPRHLLTLGVWERPDGVKEWTVPRDEVLGAIDAALVKYEVRLLAADDTFGRIWAMDMEALQQKGIEVIEWPTRSQSRIAPAAAQVYGAIKDLRLTHDGDSRLTAHVGHCVTKGTRWGLVPTKESPDSPRHIDCAIAVIIADDTAVRQSSSDWAVATTDMQGV